MQDYHGVVLGIGSAHPDQRINTEWRRLWYSLGEMDKVMRELGPATARISNNQRPDGSGTPIAPPFDESILNSYVYMPGRAVDQVVNALASTNVALTVKGASGGGS